MTLRNILKGAFLFSAAAGLLGACSARTPQAPPSAPPSPPVDRATGVVLDEAEVARRVAKMKSEGEARPGGERRVAPSWSSVEEMPSFELVEPADDATVGLWIQNLGEIHGDTSRRARKQLLRQGSRVIGRLREVSGEETLRGLNARALLEALDRDVKSAWKLDDLSDMTLIEEGAGILAWSGDPPRDLSLIDTGTGKRKWTVGADALFELLGEKDKRFFPPYTIPVLDPKSGNYVVLVRDDFHVAVDPRDGKLTKVESVSPAEGKGRRRYYDSTEDEFREMELPDHSRVRWRKNGAWVRRADTSEWNQLTIGALQCRLQDVGLTPLHIYGLLDGVLNGWNRKNLKLEMAVWAPRGAKWMHISPQSGLVILGGPGWKSLAVLGGFEPVPLGRCPAQFGAMTMMAVDPQKRWIATADEEGFIRVFLAETLERIATVPAGIPVDRLEFCADPPVLMAISGRDEVWAHNHQVRAWRIVPPATAK